MSLHYRRFSALFAVALLLPFAVQARPASKALRQEDALARSRRVSKVHYDLFVELSREDKEFTGTVKAGFRLKGKGDLTLDFIEGTVTSVKVNGKKVDAAYNGFFLTLPGSALKRGRNSVEIVFSHPYSKGGAGLYRSKDPEDGRVYVYSDFEPYDANKLFPCFDQPDLKASYTLTAKVPGNWKVISSVLEDEVLMAEGGKSLWKFPKSKVFSTYIFSLIAGPYREWKSSYEDTPIRLFARESLAPHVDVDEWFTITRQGLKFFNEYFDYPYPFGKYDQIIVPDFNAGAMENVAAVTFTEWYVYRGEPTNRQRERRASTILHEMSHMWFGDLVTMRWWDDLWLNESFASYMASLAMVEATEFTNAWQSFFSGMKQWAYWEDQLVTTHPIETRVLDTETAFSNFDGITYGKGASVLKLVSYYLGAKDFRKGTRIYFKRYAYKNTVLKDFIGSLEKGSGRKLAEWSKNWLQSAGVNTVKAEYTCSRGKISSFKLLQTAEADYPVLRGHKTAIGLFSIDSKGRLTATTVLPSVEYQGDETVVKKLVGKPCPLIVYPNVQDHDYVKVALDERSLQAVREQLSDVTDDLSRAMLWRTLWDMVRDGDLGLPAYTDLVMKHIVREKNVKTAGKVLGTISGGGNSVLGYLPRKGKEGGFRKKLIGRLEGFYWSQLDQAEEGSDFQKLWYDKYVGVAESPASHKKLLGVLAGKVTFPEFEIDQDRRWGIVYHLSQKGHPKAASLRKAEKKKDPSRRGQTMAISAEASVPSWKVKKRWLDKILGDDQKLKLADLKAAMSGIFPDDQDDMRARFSGDFYKKLPKISREKTNEFVSRFASNLVPVRCEASETDRLGAFIEENGDLNAVVLKKLKVAKQEDERCLKIRSRAISEIGSL